MLTFGNFSRKNSEILQILQNFRTLKDQDYVTFHIHLAEGSAKVTA